MAIKNDTEKKAEVKKAEAKKTEAKKLEEQLVEVYIPVDYSDDEASLYVAVNGVAMLVPKGQRVKVKPEYAEAINLSLALKDANRQKEVEARRQADANFINTSY